jgi:hypothetical protein
VPSNEISYKITISDNAGYNRQTLTEPLVPRVNTGKARIYTKRKKNPFCDNQYEHGVNSAR